MKKLLFILLTFVTAQTYAQDTTYVKVRSGTPGAYNIALNQTGDSLTWYVQDVRHAIAVGSGTDAAAYHNIVQSPDSSNYYTITKPNGIADTILFIGDSTLYSSMNGAGLSRSTVDSILGGYYTRGQVDSIAAVTKSLFNGGTTGQTLVKSSNTDLDFSWSTPAGSTNSNTGSGYRLAVPFTNNIRTVFSVSPILLDSISNTNALTFKFDTSVVHTSAYNNGLYGSLSQQNANTSNIASNTTAIGTKADKATTITINGTTQDLSANRSWTVAGGSGSDTTRVSKILPDTTLKSKTFLSDLYLKGPFLQENIKTRVDVNTPTTTNANTYLTTPTYDGSGQAAHPDVYYNANGWNGYKYWMAMTPYTNGSDLTENPSLLCSNDGVTWIVPPGVTNPIAPAPPSTQFQADAEIIPPGAYDNKLRVIYRRTIERTTDSTSIYSRSYDGVAVSSEINIIPNIRDSLVSPCVIERNGVYTMYYTNIYTTPYSLQKRTSTNPDGPWSNAINCTLMNPTGLYLWHVNANTFGDQITLWATMCTAGTQGLGAKLYYATSDDGTNFTVSSNLLLGPSVSGWDNSLIYRSCAILLDGGTKRYGLFYTGMNSSTVWHVGYTEVSLSSNNTSQWSLTGNAGLSYLSNFIGTTDSQSVRLRTSNTERIILDSLGNFKYTAGKSWGNIGNNYTPANPTATGLQNNYLYLFYNPNTASRWTIGLDAGTNMAFQNNGAQGFNFYQGATKVAAGINTSGNFQQTGGFYGFDPNSSGLVNPTTTNQPYTYSLYNNTSNPSKIGISGLRNGHFDMYFQSLNGGFRWYTNTGGSVVELGSISDAGNLLLNTTTDIASSIATFNSTTKGALIPRMTKTQRNAISSPAPGLMIIVTGETGGEYLSWYNSSSSGWVKVSSVAD